MKEMLESQYEGFLASYEEPCYRGIRLNLLKCSLEILKESLPFELSPSKFSEDSFYAPTGEKFGGLFAHHAGMFYSQEPSASSAVTILDPNPGEKILDLCAAPGGKSTQIAARLEGKGLLWANEIVRQRANILLSNIERMGVKNAVVSSLSPEKLCAAFPQFFDKLLVDAPCSGEGMFKKEPQAIEGWSTENVEMCARRQLSILDSAAAALKLGGVMVYSTCTFSKEENEYTVAAFLEAHPEFELLPIEVGFGRSAFGMPALRIFPMDGGEGHFVAKLRKKFAESDMLEDRSLSGFTGDKKQPMLETAKKLYSEMFSDHVPPMTQIRDKIYILPDMLPNIGKIPVLRAGVLFGEVKGGRIEPAHAVFMSKNAGECQHVLELDPLSGEKYFRGEEIDCGSKGYTAVSVNKVVTGFGKASGGRLKNKYPKGLRSRR